MKRDRNDLVETIILGILGSLVVLTLTAPQLLQDRSPPPLLSLSILLRDTDSSGWTVARQGMEQAADELGAELRFLTLTAQNDSEEQTAVLFREIDGGADALVVVPAGPDELTLALSQRPDHCPVVTLESTVRGRRGSWPRRTRRWAAGWPRPCWRTGRAGRCCCWIPSPRRA